MLQKVSKVLLLSDVSSFAENYKALAEEVNVNLAIESEWNIRYRVSAEKVILGSKYLPKLNRAYYPIAVLMLKEGESPAPYIKVGINQFIFDYKNNYELLCAFYRLEKTVVHTSSKDLEKTLNECDVHTFKFGDYDFMFDKNRFCYKGKQIYLYESTKCYLAEWLLNGHKDNKKRMVLCNLRKKFGADFLKDVDRFGRLKE